jgi:hypothetical protein
LLSQHDISTPETVEAAIHSAMTKWLDNHTAEIIDAIARQQEGNQT